MNTRILLLALSVAALSSCSSVYRSGQTPDDVYYSPAPARQAAKNNGGDNDYVDVRQPKQGTNYQTYDQYQDSYRDDRFLRMSVGNPYYMNNYNTYSGFDWRYNSYYDGFNFGYSSPWNNYFAWNNFYNPYYSAFYSPYLGFGYGGYGGYYGGGYGVVAGGGIKTSYSASPISKPRVFNVNSYRGSNRPAGSSYVNGMYNNGNRYNNANTNSNRNANNGNSYYNNNNGRSMNTAPANNTNTNSYTPSRSYTPSSSGGGGGGGGSVSRPSRGN